MSCDAVEEWGVQREIGWAHLEHFQRRCDRRLNVVNVLPKNEWQSLG
jgi:hypothetical protein